MSAGSSELAADASAVFTGMIHVSQTPPIVATQTNAAAASQAGRDPDGCLRNAAASASKAHSSTKPSTSVNRYARRIDSLDAPIAPAPGRWRTKVIAEAVASSATSTVAME